MPEKDYTNPSEIKISKLDIPFLADQVAELNVTLHTAIDAAKTALDFEDFKRKLTDTLKEVRVTSVINVDAWLADQTQGFVVLVRPIPPEVHSVAWENANPVDYWRDEEGLPIIYPSKNEVHKQIPTDYSIVRILDLKEEHERKN